MMSADRKTKTAVRNTISRKRARVFCASLTFENKKLDSSASPGHEMCDRAERQTVITHLKGAFHACICLEMVRPADDAAGLDCAGGRSSVAARTRGFRDRAQAHGEIGRASCRERVQSSVGPRSF